jgi:branched-chain amino acid transport system substrate-binding protein
MTKRIITTRRRFLQTTATGALATGLFASSISTPAIASDRVIKIGYVSPQTGPLAPFGEADSFVVDQIRNAMHLGVDFR